MGGMREGKNMWVGALCGVLRGGTSTVRGLSLAVALVMGLGLAVTPAGALSLIPAINFDTYSLGGSTLVAQQTSTFTSTFGAELADLTVEVYHNTTTGIFTYAMTVDPTDQQTHNISEVNTGFNVLGFTGVAGYSFSDAIAAGATTTPLANVFNIFLENDGTVDFERSVQAATEAGGFWDGGAHIVPITFFFESTFAPALGGNYNLINSEAGGAVNLKPVPEPASLLLLGSGLVALGLWRRAKG